MFVSTHTRLKSNVQLSISALESSVRKNLQDQRLLKYLTQLVYSNIMIKSLFLGKHSS